MFGNESSRAYMTTTAPNVPAAVAACAHRWQRHDRPAERACHPTQDRVTLYAEGVLTQDVPSRPERRSPRDAGARVPTLDAINREGQEKSRHGAQHPPDSRDR